ncbi:aspartate aminotransferase family protein [Rhodopseudomonas boonkerdii]|nr:aspartate aminotransferase family protein [Rhodopseudomonas boonkerdii]UGV27226.1 aspartate aminotransferase family protein [Rhodopseudomonas boonkerdii]
MISPGRRAVTVHQIPNSLQLDTFWMPFTANRQFKAAPRMFASAKGMYYTTEDGRQVIDGSAGLWCTNAGHGRREIASAVEKQLSTLDFAPAFQMGHPLAFEFANRLAEIAPAGLDRIFFTNSGSESGDTALKIAIAYQRAIGQATRTRLIGRERGYHGVGFGGTSVGGMVNNRRAFVSAQLPGIDHIRHTHDLARNAFSKDLPEYGAEFADDVERLVALHGADTIAAVIIEPVPGSTGVLPPPKGYLERLRELCTKHGILLIFDEVITGFGRLGAPFAAQYFGVTPDIMTTAKGITNGTVPCGAVFASRKIYDGLMTGPESQIELFHGYTYSAHPVACAAGIATLDIYKNEGLLTRGASMAEYWRDSLHALKGLPNVIDIRNCGLMGAVELAPRKDAPGARGYEVMVDCFNTGLYLRQSSDAFAMSPPLTVEKNHIDDMMTILSAAIKRVA